MRRRSRSLLATPLTAVLLVAFGAVGATVLPPAAGQAQPPSCADTGEDGAAAHILAKACGRRVEVLAARTETGQVFANPGGNYTFESTLKPTRAKRADGSWVRADATLSRTEDGMVRPVAAALPILFSGGGTGPIAQVRKDDKSLALRWIDDTPLPVPVLDGPSALYPDVLPGVDLKLTADVDGFAEVLIVKTRAAAASPALRSLRFRTSAQHLSLRVDPVSGGVSAVDASGAVVFGGSTPMMWDSADTPTSAQAAEVNGHTLEIDAGHGEGGRLLARQRKMAATVDTGSLTVVPDAKLLADPATKFPVQIDPTFPGGKQHWTMLWKENGGTSYWDRTCVNCDTDESNSGVVRVGYQAFNGVSTVRSLFQMDISGVVGAHITKATFSITQSWSGKACGGPAGPTSLWWANGINSGMTWNNPGSLNWAAKLSSNSEVRRFNGSGACTQGRVEWNALTGVIGSAGGGSPSITVGLRADNESDQYAWRRYKLDPAMTIDFNNPPNLPDTLTVAATPQEHGEACVGGANRPILRSTTVTMKAHVTDPNGDNMRVWFVVAKWNPATGTWSDVTSGYQDPVVSNGTAQHTASGLVDGGRYTFRVLANDHLLEGPVTGIPGNCEFDIDATAPGIPASVTSVTYPADGSFYGSPGKTGDFTINPPAVHPEDVDHYVYALTPFTTPPSDGTRTIAASPTTHGATLPLTPTQDGVNELRVWSVDKAGNASPIGSPRTYSFMVSDPTLPVGTWVGDDPAGSTSMLDTSGWGHDANATNVTFGAAGRVIAGPTAPRFTGSPSSAAVTAPGASPEFDTARSFSVAAWVQLTTTPGASTYAIVSRDGTRTSAFQLGYSNGDNRWRFALEATDVDAPFLNKVLSNSPPAVNTWTFLVGTYDSATGTMRLYVDGIQQTSVVTGATSFTANGGLAIGRRRWAGGADLGFPGHITDVSVWDRVIYPNEIAALSAGLAGSWSLDGNGSDDTGRHPVVPVAGAGWGTDRFSTPNSAAALTGAWEMSLQGSGPALRTEQSFTVSAWVKLTTGGPNNYTAVSQDGLHSSAFLLGYDGGQNRWRFGVTLTDVDGGTISSVYSSSAPVLHQWIHLVGVYNASTGTITIYINGVAQGSNTASLGWSSNGPLRIGRATWSTVAADCWPGGIDDVQVYQGAMAPAAVANL